MTDRSRARALAQESIARHDATGWFDHYALIAHDTGATIARCLARADASRVRLLVWGEDDPTFPLERARAMAGDFPDGRGVAVIPRTKLLPHEERPDAVRDAVLPFLG